MQNYLKTYIRDKNRNPKGVAVVVLDEDGQFKFGYSLCCPKDQFDKELGTKIALRRANDRSLGFGQALCPLVPERRELITSYYLGLERRASRYFQTETHNP